MTEVSNSERRSYRRVKLSTRIDIEADTPTGFVSGYTMIVSEGGAFIVADSPWPPGTSFKFGIRPRKGVRPVRGVAEVVWIRREAEGRDRPAGMGVRFSEIADEDQEILRSVLAFEAGGDDGRATDVFKPEELDSDDTWTDGEPPTPADPDPTPQELEPTLVIPDPAPADSAATSAAVEPEPPTTEPPPAVESEPPLSEEPEPVRFTRKPPPTRPLPADEFRRGGKRAGSWLAAAAAIVLVVVIATFAAVKWHVGGGSRSENGSDAELAGETGPMVVATTEEDELWGAQPSPKMVQEIWCTVSESGSVVVIQGSGQGSGPFIGEQVSCGRLEDPPRYVIQLFGMTEPFQSESVPADAPGLQGIRVGHHENGELLETRIVLDLSSVATRVVEPLIQDDTILVEVQDLYPVGAASTTTVEDRPGVGASTTTTIGVVSPVGAASTLTVDPTPPTGGASTTTTAALHH
jgi:uncharacterized protein (TIGR02266 family)